MNHTEENKENIPPFDYNGLITYFDRKFEKHDDYRTYIDTHLKEWADDTDFLFFNYAYCHHRLMEIQDQQCLRIEREMLSIKATARTNNETAIANANNFLSRLKRKGFDRCIAKIENPPKRAAKEPVDCPTCRLPLKYDHIAWCRGLTDGYTCQCNKTPTVTRTVLSIVPYRPRTRCFVCQQTNHTKQDCTNYQCRICKIWAPGHRFRNCPNRLQRTIKEEEDSSTAADDGTGYFDIEGYEDGNLNGEC